VSTPSAGLPSVRGLKIPLSGQLADLGYGAGWRVVRAMPEFAARNAFDAGAWYASRGGGPEQLRKNLARVIGVPPAKVPGSLIRESLASYARYWREAFRLPSMDHQVLARRLNDAVEGGENVAAALEAGRGAILALPHSGNWDMSGVWLTNTYGPRQLMKHGRQGFIPVFIRQAMEGKPIRLFGGGGQRRDANYVTDVVDAFLRAARVAHACIEHDPGCAPSNRVLPCPA